MDLDINAITDAVASHAAASGHFEQVNIFEAMSSPNNGMWASVWPQQINPIQRRSGLNTTSALLLLQVRIYKPMGTDPRDMIDPDMIRAINALMVAYSGDFSLGGVVAEIDLLGAYGQPLASVAGYMEMDGTMIRTMDIMMPLVINDVWVQTS
jgi:hypothetical protein